MVDATQQSLATTTRTLLSAAGTEGLAKSGPSIVVTGQESTGASVAVDFKNSNRPAGVVAISASLPDPIPVRVVLQLYGEPLVEQYQEQIVRLIMDNTGVGKAFDEGSFSDRSIRTLLKLSIRNPENFSPTIVAIDQENEALVGVMLGSRPLGTRDRAAESADKRLAEIYRLIDVGKFPFTDAADKAEAQSKIWVPCGIITVADEKYRGQGIGRRLYREALNSLQQEPYRSVKYLATGHKVDNAASTKLHDSVGASQEYLTDAAFKYKPEATTGEKCIRIFTLNRPL